jgi:hypothetical protein
VCMHMQGGAGADTVIGTSHEPKFGRRFLTDYIGHTLYMYRSHGVDVILLRLGRPVVANSSIDSLPLERFQRRSSDISSVCVRSD